MKQQNVNQWFFQLFKRYKIPLFNVVIINAETTDATPPVLNYFNIINIMIKEYKLETLYEKLGYIRTGVVENINERMDIVYYEKN